MVAITGPASVKHGGLESRLPLLVLSAVGGKPEDRAEVCRGVLSIVYKRLCRGVCIASVLLHMHHCSLY